MNTFWDIFRPEALIRYGGVAMVVLIVFIENGIFFGFFLPGDSLLFTAGLLCYLDVLDIDLSLLIGCIFLASLLGYYAGYYFGHRTGQALYSRKDTMFFKKSYVATAERFYQRYGGVALIFGRFLPIVRTFAPILAGVVKVKHRVFFLYNIIGALLWPGIIVTSGYFVGSIFPNALSYLNYIVIAFVVITAIPIINNFRQQAKARKLKQPADEPSTQDKGPL